ncbi:transforming growth factor-beta-induced protein ig-h3 [Trichonephila clavipes]|nr:transforming growth factor-beta-induced protein ig-h3 [Trichonephila clavipes]
MSLPFHPYPLTLTENSLNEHLLRVYLVASGIEPRPSGLESDVLTHSFPNFLSHRALVLFSGLYDVVGRPSGIGVRDFDCGAVGSGNLDYMAEILDTEMERANAMNGALVETQRDLSNINSGLQRNMAIFKNRGVIEENCLSTSLNTLSGTIPVSLLPYPSCRKPTIPATFTNEVFQEYKAVCFTDGSKLNGRVGLACVIYEEGVENVPASIKR